MTAKIFVCEICGKRHPTTQRTSFDGQDLCPRCLEDETIICAHCGERIWRDDNSGNDTTPLCENCYQGYYVHCSRCGTLLHMDDASYEDDDTDAPYCSDCYRQIHRPHNSYVIQDYYFKPDPIFLGKGPRYFGVELEIDGAGECSANAGNIIEKANREADCIYCKHDGSLEDGFEIITHPMSLEYHQHNMPWETLLREAVRMGYTSHQAGTCGLHVHVSRNAFGDTLSAQEAAIARVLYFFEKHWEELLKFSRRTPRQLDQWAARYGYKDHPKEILDHAKKGNGRGRYVCINLQNTDTIEFRIFRGILKLNTLIATLQLVNRVCDVAIYLTDDELKAMSWTSFVSGCVEPELVRYLRERRLYINEPVTAEEEV